MKRGTAPQRWRGVRVLAVGLVALVAAGCATKIEPSESWPAPAEPIVLLQPGDRLALKFVYWPELDTEQAIRPDGKIVLTLAGEVSAAGKTPAQLHDELLVVYADKIRNPEIVVNVLDFDNFRVYVGGEVRTPGLQKLAHPMTVLEAIMTAGGPLKASAKLDTVVLIRQRDGKQYTQTVNVKKALRNPESEPFYLEPHDIIFVPRTMIDRVDQFVDQYINQIVPRSVFFQFATDLNSPDLDSNNTSFTFPVSTTLP